MKKLSLLALVVLLLAAGCGKKKEESMKEEERKEFVENVDIPVLNEENEKFVDNEEVADFAFVEDDEIPVDEKKAEPAKLVEAAPTTSQSEFVWVDTEEEFTEEGTLSDEKIYEFKTINFTLNENRIREDQKAVVVENCKIAKNAVAEGRKVVIQGHCCQLGSHSYNMALSQRRADVIKREMVKAGVPEESIKTVGYGNEMPLVWSSKTDREAIIDELAVNRRAEIVIN